jgi:hypothetical protein
VNGAPVTWFQVYTNEKWASRYHVDEETVNDSLYARLGAVATMIDAADTAIRATSPLLRKAADMNDT